MRQQPGHKEEFSKYYLHGMSNSMLFIMHQRLEDPKSCRTPELHVPCAPVLVMAITPGDFVCKQASR